MKKFLKKDIIFSKDIGETNMLLKDKFKMGDIVKLRNGEICIVFPDSTIEGIGLYRFQKK
jgi:hypothetical protein